MEPAWTSGQTAAGSGSPAQPQALQHAALTPWKLRPWSHLSQKGGRGEIAAPLPADWLWDGFMVKTFSSSPLA